MVTAAPICRFFLFLIVGATAAYRSHDTEPFYHSMILQQLPLTVSSIRSRRRAQTSSTCTVDGRTFQAGDNLGNSFVTRCGSVLEWPCYCSPERDPPVECPYCSMADIDEGLVCAKNGETVSVVNLNGIPQSCSCSVSSNGNPQETCMDQNDNNQNDDNPVDEGFCTIRIFNGTMMRFENGESLGEFLPTRCPGGGVEYPCFCNTALPDQVDCPYCTWLDYRRDLICARQAESTVYENAPGEYLECACLSDFISTCKTAASTPEPLVSPVPTTQPPVKVADPPTATPTGRPTQSASMPPTESNASSNPSTVPPSPQPTPATTNLVPINDGSTQSPTVFEKNDIVGDDRPPLAESDLGGCLYWNHTSGKVEFVKEGEAFGPIIHGPCSPSGDWPVICNPAIPNGGMEYPYCVFADPLAGGSTSLTTSAGRASVLTANSSSDAFICARTQERVSVPSVDGVSQECSCLYFNPLSGPSSSCEMVSVTLELPSFSPGEGPSDDQDSTPTSTSPPVSSEETSSTPLAAKVPAMLFLATQSLYVWNWFG